MGELDPLLPNHPTETCNLRINRVHAMQMQLLGEPGRSFQTAVWKPYPYGEQPFVARAHKLFFVMKIATVG